eukprot:2588074-Heterocapsa_arctica.AAC.1
MFLKGGPLWRAGFVIGSEDWLCHHLLTLSASFRSISTKKACASRLMRLRPRSWQSATMAVPIPSKRDSSTNCLVEVLPKPPAWR